ncbi:hypothetical protein ILUMI_00251 [Ignelater luminosus]|uniref:Uncharacterized protein n=1 Tax=Ignelater luminosus TaxID=2038154 RepID=A0A8K0GLF0_IGNLU|nr:hypothetical protein ILUMI_00251 [Ignelater luminosus]
MAIMPCPKTWVFPFPPGMYPDAEVAHHESRRVFFSHILPGVIVRKVKPIHRQEHPRCSWKVYCKLENYINPGLADYVYRIVDEHKCMNTSIGKLNIYDSYNFSVIYNIDCNCNTVDI